VRRAPRAGAGVLTRVCAGDDDQFADEKQLLMDEIAKLTA
jgi:hypothetical protein